MKRRKILGPWIICAVILLGISIYLLLNPAPTERYLPAFADIQENYTVRQAEQDGCIIFNGQSVWNGQTRWKDFIQLVDEGKNLMVRIYRYSKSCQKLFSDNNDLSNTP